MRTDLLAFLTEVECGEDQEEMAYKYCFREPHYPVPSVTGELIRWSDHLVLHGAGRGALPVSAWVKD